MHVQGSLKVGFVIILWIVIPHLAGHKFQVDEEEAMLGNVDSGM
jgi:hypothetical protein